jgi:hypothetical protein
MTWLADTVLAALALEALAVIVFAARLRLSRGAVLAALAPGAALVLALRFALQNRSAAAIGAALLLAMGAHAYDVLRNRRR